MKRSLKSIFTGLILGIAGLSIAIGFGGQGFFVSTGGFAAKVGETTVTPEELIREARAQYNRFLQFQPELTPDQARAAGVGRFALSALLARAVLAEEARTLRLAVSDEALIDEIRGIEAFQDPITDEFDRQAYRLALSRGQYDEASFEDGLREDLIRSQLVDALNAAAAPLPDAIAEAGVRYAIQRRAASYVTLQPSRVEAPEDFSDEEIMLLIETNPAPFENAARRIGVAAVVDPAFFEDAITVDEASVRAAYEAGQYEGAADARETRTLILMPFGRGEAAETRANEAAAALRADDALGLAERFGLDPARIRLDEATEDQVSDPVAAEKAFTLDVGAVEAFQGALGWFALKVVDVNAPERPAFEDVREDIAAEFRRAGAVERAYDAAAALDERVAEGATLEEATGAVEGASLKSYDLDREGRFPTRPLVDDDLAPQVAEEFFLMEAGELGVLQESEDGVFFIPRLDRAQPRARRPFEDIREQAVRILRNQAIDRGLRELAATVREEAAAAEGGLAQVAEDRGLTLIETPNGLARNQPEEIIGPEDATRIVALKPGELYAAKARYGLAWFVAEAGALEDRPLDDAVLARFKSQESGTYVQAAVDAYLQEARGARDVQVRDDLVEQALEQAF